jgi:hypothetical protein
MIYKGNEEVKDPANNRGISLHSTLSKIYTGKVAERMSGLRREVLFLIFK